MCSCENIFNIFPLEVMDQLNDPIFQALDAAVLAILVGISKLILKTNCIFVGDFGIVDIVMVA